jgi:hypothetical protein
MWKKIQVPVMLLALLVVGAYYYANTHGLTIRELFYSSPYSVVHIGDVPLNVEVADTPEKRTQGLSGRDSIKPIQGMLFVFDRPDYYGFWMKDMQFPIDIIWISADLKVVGITTGLLPSSYPKTYEPPEPILYALETPRYFSESFGIKTGDSVEIPKKYIR